MAKLAPEDCLKHLDGVAAKYHGTRQDHELLGHSTQVLQQVIAEWREMKAVPTVSPKLFDSTEN